MLQENALSQAFSARVQERREVDPGSTMSRLLHVFWVLCLALGGGLLGLGVAALNGLLLTRHDLVKVDPAALLVTDGALEASESGLVEAFLVDARIGGVLLLAHLQESDGSLLEGVLTSPEELGVVVESIPLLLLLLVFFFALVFLLLVLGKLLWAGLLVLLGALLGVGGFFVLASLGLDLFLLGHLAGNDFTALEMLVHESELMAVVGLSGVVLLSKFKPTISQIIQKNCNRQSPSLTNLAFQTSGTEKIPCTCTFMLKGS